MNFSTPVFSILKYYDLFSFCFNELSSESFFMFLDNIYEIVTIIY